MKRNSSPRDKKSRKCVTREINGNKRSCQDDAHSTKYFSNIVPEETVRSSLPSALADEYLSFVQQCEKQKRKDDIASVNREFQQEETSQIEEFDEGGTAELKENLPAEKQNLETGSIKKVTAKKGRRRENTKKNLLKCLLCSKEFPTKQMKQEHYNDHLGPRGYECTFCVKVFDKMPALVSHVSRIHLIDKNLVCKICGKKFRREWLLRSHSLTHASGRKFSCPMCKMGFTHKRHLFEHISGHVNFNPYKCEECGKRFQKSSYLSLHRKLHVCVRPFVCKICGVQFGSYSTMTTHVLKHSENLVLKCVDGKAKVPGSMMNARRASHSRTKNYACSFCPTKFHARSTLKDHLKAHSYVKEYKCDVCEKVLRSVNECSDHDCLKWEKQGSVVLCPICRVYLKRELIGEHNSKRHAKPNPARSNSCPETDEDYDDPSNEEGEYGTVGSGGHESDVSSSWNEDDNSSTSNISHFSSDDAETADGNEAGFCVNGSLASNTVCQSESLDLDFGLVHQMRQVQNEVEEDDSDNNDDM